MTDNQFLPFTMEPDTDEELRKTRHLKQYLTDQKLYESSEDGARREEALGILDLVVKNWVRLVAKQCGFVESTVQEANAKLYTFGSYRLGVHAPVETQQH